ncbi:MAG: DNA polymerase III subunit chi [Burkholderiales bacterium]|nr:DNA polymerase III subunit chi [Burkholderiales bacterium]
MTEVTFHFNAPDKLGYVCNVVRSVAAKGRRIVVTGEPQALRQLDVALWTFEPLEFLPHCHAAGATAAVLQASPVVLAEAPRAAPHQEVLVNLGPGIPEGFERFERLVEVVTQGDDDRMGGRQRAKHYKDRGYPVRHYNVATREML